MNTETTTVEEAESSQSCPIAIIKRKENQEYKEFSEQRAESNKMIRHFCKGIMFHDSSTGTYDIGSNKIKAERKIEHELKRKRMKNIKLVSSKKY